MTNGPHIRNTGPASASGPGAFANTGYHGTGEPIRPARPAQRTRDRAPWLLRRYAVIGAAVIALGLPVAQEHPELAWHLCALVLITAGVWRLVLAAERIRDGQRAIADALTARETPPPAPTARSWTEHL